MPSSEGFSLGSPVFLPPQKINISKFQFDREFEGHGFVSRRLLCATLVKTKQNKVNLRKFKITGSRLPALLGSHGQEKFIKYWKVVKQGLKESDVINTNFENFKRGHRFEKEAISVFCKLSNSETQTCGFFQDPSDSKYGASPDALAASSIILEIKTRPAKN